MGRGNQALNVNPFVVNDRTVDIHITTHGSDWYWAVMSLMGATMLAVLFSGLARRPTDRIFHYLFAAAAFVCMVEHYAMASNLGWVPIDVEWQRSRHVVTGVNRQIWWVRYCGWFLIWPILSLAILLTAAAPLVHVLWAIFLSGAMAVLAVVGAVTRTNYKWGFYAFWIWAWWLLGYQLLWTPRRYTRALGGDVQTAHGVTAGWVWFLWMLYPICWGISEGGNLIAPDSEFIFYGILDCCLIPLTAAFFLAAHWSINPARLGLYMRSWDDPVAGPGGAAGNAGAGEKVGGTNGHGAGAAPPGGVVEGGTAPSTATTAA